MKSIETAGRTELFPDEKLNAKSSKTYYKINFDTLKQLPKPLIRERMRFIVFIPTNIYKLTRARVFNDIFNNSPLDNELWKLFYIQKISAEREYYIYFGHKNFCFDFAIFCKG